MAIANAALLAQLAIGWQDRFQEAYAKSEANWKPLALQVATKNKTETYFWALFTGTMKKWLSDAQFTSFKVQTTSITNETYQDGCEFHKDEIRYDRTDMIGAGVDDLAREAAMFPGDEIARILEAGATTVIYDGQYFFDTDHSIAGGPTQVNKTTGALTADKVAAIRLAFRNRKDPNGTRIRTKMTHLVVPPALEDTAILIRDGEFKADGVTPNPNRGTFEILVLESLTSDVAYYGVDLSMSIKPFIWQEEDPPQLVSQTDLTDEEVFMRQTFRHSAFLRGGAGYGPWHLAYMSTGA